jgi:ribosomal protein L24
MQTGDTVTIKRGKLAGTEGEVKLTNADTVVLELKNGDLITQKTSNIRVPAEATITQAELAAIVGSVAYTEDDGRRAVDAIIVAIDAKYPGFASKVSVPA